MEIERTFYEGRGIRGTYRGCFSYMWMLDWNHGVPCLIWHEQGERQPRGNSPRILFCSDKNIKTPSESRNADLIPMMICDEPHIPEEFAHIKHNLDDAELGYLKEWVRRNEELLLAIGEGSVSVENIDDCWKDDKHSAMIEALRRFGDSGTTETFPYGCMSRGMYGGFYSDTTWLNRENGAPCVVRVECSEHQPRWNRPRIKFYADKSMSCPADSPGADLIPMTICDEPRIPEEFAHVKHNLDDADLEALKKWIVGNKELLMDLGDGTTDYFSFCDKLRKGGNHAATE